MTAGSRDLVASLLRAACVELGKFTPEAMEAAEENVRGALACWEKLHTAGEVPDGWCPSEMAACRRLAANANALWERYRMAAACRRESAPEARTWIA